MQNISKKAISFVLTLALVFSVAAGIPAVTDSNKVYALEDISGGQPYHYEYTASNGHDIVLFFANGIPVTIKDANEASNGTTPQGVAITWSGQTGGPLYLNGDAINVFGGGYDNNTTRSGATRIDSTSVTVESGTLHNVFGGGLYASDIGTSNVIIKGGNIAFVMGGGTPNMETDAEMQGTFTMPSSLPDNPSDFQNKVENANVTISGGTIVDGTGGSSGIAYVKNANTTISGGEITKAYSVAGVNGRVDNASLTMTGGKISGFLQSVNRGEAGDVKTEIKDGTVNDAYVYGHEPQGTTNVAKITGTNSFTISGGKVSNLKMGYIGDGTSSKQITSGSDIPADALKLAYNSKLITNLDPVVSTVAKGLGGNFTDLTPKPVVEKKKYKVTFKANGSKAKLKTKSKKVTAGAKFGKLPTPKRTGYKFKGWYTKKKGGKKITRNSKMTYKKNITLYAHWTGNAKIKNCYAVKVHNKYYNSAKVITYAKHGQTVYYIKKAKFGWYKVKVNKKTGYIYKKFVKRL